MTSYLDPTNLWTSASSPTAWSPLLPHQHPNTHTLNPPPISKNNPILFKNFSNNNDKNLNNNIDNFKNDNNIWNGFNLFNDKYKWDDYPSNLASKSDTLSSKNVSTNSPNLYTQNVSYSTASYVSSYSPQSHPPLHPSSPSFVPSSGTSFIQSSGTSPSFLPSSGTSFVQSSVISPSFVPSSGTSFVQSSGTSITSGTLSGVSNGSKSVIISHNNSPQLNGSPLNGLIGDNEASFHSISQISKTPNSPNSTDNNMKSHEYTLKSKNSDQISAISRSNSINSLPSLKLKIPPTSSSPVLDSPLSYSPSYSPDQFSSSPQKIQFYPFSSELDNIPSAIESELSRQNLYKTELCRSWVESNSCKYGNKCQFAHGKNELRPVIRHPKYKTEICKTFHINGTCPYGKRCRFVHNPLVELRIYKDDDPSIDNEKDLELIPSSVEVSKTNGSRLPVFQKLRKLQM